MSTKRRSFTAEFKQQAVELALANGDIGQTARDLGVDRSNLRKWIKQYQDSDATPFPGSGTARDQQLADMKKRLHDLEQENAILKKAIGIFARCSR